MGLNSLNGMIYPNFERIRKMYSELVIMKSCFGSKEQDIKDNLDFLLSEHRKYKSKKMPLLLGDEVIPQLKFLQISFDNSGEFPSEKLFLTRFPELMRTLFLSTTIIAAEDFRVYIANFIKERLNQQIALQIDRLKPHIRNVGISDSVQSVWEELKSMSGATKTPNITLRQNSRDNYNERLSKPLGMQTGIKRIDELIFGMNEGSVNVIAGFTSHYKTLFAMNIAYLNSYHYGYNIAYLSLETPKDQMYDQLLTRHSYDMKFPQYEYIPSCKIRSCLLSSMEQDYLFDVIEPDLYTDYINADGNTGKRGLVTFFDLSDFDTFHLMKLLTHLKHLTINSTVTLTQSLLTTCNYVNSLKVVQGSAMTTV